MHGAVSIRVVSGESPDTSWLVAEVHAAGPGLVVGVSYALDEPPTTWCEDRKVDLGASGVYVVRSDRRAGAVGPPRIHVQGAGGFWQTG